MSAEAPAPSNTGKKALLVGLLLVVIGGIVVLALWLTGVIHGSGSPSAPSAPPASPQQQQPQDQTPDQPQQQGVPPAVGPLIPGLSPSSPPPACSSQPPPCGPDKFAQCHAGAWLCDQCADFGLWENHCPAGQFPRCQADGRTICEPCPHWDNVKATCTGNANYVRCNGTGTVSCVQCPDFPKQCGVDSFPRCQPDGTTTCVPCPDFAQVQSTCGLDQYAQCAADGSGTQCITCNDFASTTCGATEQPQCLNGKTQCVACGQSAARSPTSSPGVAPLVWTPAAAPVCASDEQTKCLVAADRRSAHLQCVTKCPPDGHVANCTGPDHKEVCNYTASPPRFECQYIGACKDSPHARCNEQEDEVCQDGRWQCRPRPGTQEAYAQAKGLHAKQFPDKTGTCPNGVCTVYCSDETCNVPVMPTVGPYDFQGSTRCQWRELLTDTGDLDQAAIKLINNPPFNLVRQPNGTLAVEDIGKNASLVPYTFKSLMTKDGATTYTNRCYLSNMCGTGTTSTAVTRTSNQAGGEDTFALKCTCDATHYGDHCNYTQQTACNAHGVPNVRTACGTYVNGQLSCTPPAREGDPARCDCPTGGWSTWSDQLTGCTCEPGFAGFNCQFSRSGTCNNHGTPDHDGGCTTCDAGFGGVHCELGRDFCNNAGVPGRNAAGFPCVCDTTPGAEAAGNMCQYTRANTCNGRGKPRADGKCDCDNRDWTDQAHWSTYAAGDQCQFTRANTCNDHGVPGQDGKCICDPNYGGATCEKSRWATCNGHGTPNADGTCRCDPGYAGPQCQFSSATTCNNHGDPNDQGQCRCYSLIQPGQGYAFTGARCENAIGPVQWSNLPSFHADMPLGLTIPNQNWAERAPVTASRGMNTWMYTPDQKLCLVSKNSPGQNSGWCLGYDAATNGSPLYITQTNAKTFAWDYANGGPIMPTEKNTTNPLADDSFSLNVPNHIFVGDLSPVMLFQNAVNNPLQFGGKPNDFYSGTDPAMPAPNQFVNKVPVCPTGFMGLACDQKTPFKAIRDGDDVAFKVVNLSNGRALNYSGNDANTAYTAYHDDNTSISKGFAFKFKPNYQDKTAVAMGWPFYKLVDLANRYADLTLTRYGGMLSQPDGTSWAVGLGPTHVYKGNGYEDIARAGVKVLPLRGFETEGICLLQHLNSPSGTLRTLGLGAGTVDGARRVVEGFFYEFDNISNDGITLDSVLAGIRKQVPTAQLNHPDLVRLLWKLVPVKPGENLA